MVSSKQPDADISCSSESAAEEVTVLDSQDKSDSTFPLYALSHNVACITAMQEADPGIKTVLSGEVK